MKTKFKNKTTLVVIIFSFIFSSIIVYASTKNTTITKPHTFSAGTTISSSEINENFDVIYQRVNDISNIQYISSSGGREANAVCPTDYTVTGGGCNCGVGKNIEASHHYYSTSPLRYNIWKCRCDSTVNNATAYAVCMKN